MPIDLKTAVRNLASQSTLSQKDRLQKAMSQMAGQKSHALAMFRPMPHQLPIFSSRSTENLIRGGNRCLGGESEIFDPVANRQRRIDQIDDDFHVFSRNPETGELEVKRVSQPFIKGHGELCQATLSNGEKIVVTERHLVLLTEGIWTSIKEAHAKHAPLLASRCGGTVRNAPAVSTIPVRRDGEFWASHPASFSLDFVPDESLYVESLRPLRRDAIWDISVEDHANYWMAGLTHANSGKSVCMAALFTSAMLRQPVMGLDGKPLPHYFPVDRHMTAWLIGLGEDHIGQTFHRLLFEEGAFWIIQDEETGQTRTFDPIRDANRLAERKPAPPFIPPNAIQDNIIWEKRGERVFARVNLKNGSCILAFTSKGDVKMGDPVDLIWIDEDIAIPRHYNEYVARLSDVKGRVFWTTWPTYGQHNVLRRLSDRAGDQAGKKIPDVFEHVISFSANKYIDPDEKRKRIEAWYAMGGIDEVRARDAGEFMTQNVLMYPQFRAELHGTPKPHGDDWDALDHYLSRTFGRPGKTWTRFLALDPGWGTTAVLFIAIPPPREFGDFVVVYDELYLHHHDAAETAKKIYDKACGFFFDAFIIDHHMGRQTLVSTKQTVEERYKHEFERIGLVSRRTDSGFLHGSDNVEAGCECVREWLAIRDDGTTKIRVVTEKVPQFCTEMRSYRRQIMKDHTKDRPAPNQADHLMDAARYLAAEPTVRYVHLSDPGDALMPSPAWKEFQKLQGTLHQTQDEYTCWLGAGAAA